MLDFDVFADPEKPAISLVDKMSESGDVIRECG